MQKQLCNDTPWWNGWPCNFYRTIKSAGADPYGPTKVFINFVRLQQQQQRHYYYILLLTSRLCESWTQNCGARCVVRDIFTFIATTVTEWIIIASYPFSELAKNALLPHLSQTYNSCAIALATALQLLFHRVLLKTKCLWKWEQQHFYWSKYSFRGIYYFDVENLRLFFKCRP